MVSTDSRTFSISPTYYRSRLSSEEQKAYLILVNALLAHQSRVTLHPLRLNKASIVRTVQAVHLDHPELFYVDFWRFTLLRDPLTGNAAVNFHLMIEQDISQKVLSTLHMQTLVIKDKVDQAIGIKEKYIELIRAVSGSINYDDTDSAFWDHTIAGPLLLHSAVCEGIAKIFLYYCQRICLPCANIAGTLAGIPHAWNMVEIGQSIFYVDITAVLSQMYSETTFPINWEKCFKTKQDLLRAGYTWDSGQKNVDDLPIKRVSVSRGSYLIK